MGVLPVHDQSALVFVGRPVLIAGTAFKAAKNAKSDMAASALTPARINSLFLAALASLPARCLRSSRTVYSALGMVKLSRTSFGFFNLTGFSAFGFATGLTNVLVKGLAGALSGALTAALTSALAIEADLFEAGLAVTLDVTFATTITGSTGVVATLGRTSGVAILEGMAVGVTATVTAFTELAVRILFSAVVMWKFP